MRHLAGVDKDRVDKDRYAGPFNRPTATPLLLLNARLDAASSWQRAQIVARSMPRARLLGIEGAGHTQAAVGSSCADRALARYLVARELPTEGASCPQDSQPFEAPANGRRRALSGSRGASAETPSSSSVDFVSLRLNNPTLEPRVAASPGTRLAAAGVGAMPTRPPHLCASHHYRSRPQTWILAADEQPFRRPPAHGGDRG